MRPLSLAAFFCATLGLSPLPAQVEIGKHKILELVFTAASSPANPFETYLLKLEVADPAGKTFALDGFYDGDGSGGQDGDYFFPAGNFLDPVAGLPMWSYLGEETTDTQRQEIISRHRDLYAANKYYFYVSNHPSAGAALTQIVVDWNRPLPR